MAERGQLLDLRCEMPQCVVDFTAAARDWRWRARRRHHRGPTHSLLYLMFCTLVVAPLYAAQVALFVWLFSVS